jgi:hypothetical protein
MCVCFNESTAGVKVEKNGMRLSWDALHGEEVECVHLKDVPPFGMESFDTVVVLCKARVSSKRMTARLLQ